mmetsp:Transcript_33750/g.94987  ORF Transcript_33750/g.94987 Transcript_33750/m.94987 type:complete len:256 (+) Transcript_33750:165-932(+)
MRLTSGVLVLTALMVLSASAKTTWPCTFSFSNNYDLNSISDTEFDAVDGNDNDYFFKVCDPTTVAGGISSTKPCDADTQVCQQSVTTGVSCGIGPPTTSELSILNGVSTSGVVMKTTGGVVGCGNTARSTTINVVCIDDFSGKAEGSLDAVDEEPPCTYTINLYTIAGCPGNGGGGGSGGIPGGAVFIIILVCVLVIYICGGVGYNYYKGNRGVELVPNLEFWKDLPYLLKDGVMFIVNTATGKSGSYGGSTASF